MLTIKLIPLLLGVWFSNAAKESVKFVRYGFPTADFINNDNSLKIICHGLNASSDTFWYQPMIKELQRKNFSVITVDWRDLADDGYIDAIVAASDVSEKLANEILELKDKFYFNLSSIHIVGHSLGAHIAGYTGKSIFESTGEKIGRITGLDPAGPGFHSLLSSSRLSKDDAQFVDVIHTDSDFLGISLSIGHADFYPNGGALQNSCDVVDIGCSHRLAPEYFIESITSDNLIAKKCGSYLWYIWGFCQGHDKATMGNGCDSMAHGDYYLTTNNKSPYGKGI